MPEVESSERGRESKAPTNMLNLFVMSRRWLALRPFDLFVWRYSLTSWLILNFVGTILRFFISASVASSRVFPYGFSFLAQLIAESLRSAGRAVELLPNCLCSASAYSVKWSASAFVRKNLLERLPALFLRPSTTHLEVAECSYFATRIFEGRIVPNNSF